MIVAAIIVIVLILVVGFGVYLGTSFDTTSTLQTIIPGSPEISPTSTTIPQSLTTSTGRGITTSTPLTYATSNSSGLQMVASLTLQVVCCPALDQTFRVGNIYSFRDFAYAPPPPTVVNGTTRQESAGVLLVFAVTNGLQTQNVSFAWSGTFSETVPLPSNAPAFGGNVDFLWFVNSTNLYVTISVYGTPPSSTSSSPTFQTSNNTSTVTTSFNQTCTPAITVTQNNTTEVITLCHHETTPNTSEYSTTSSLSQSSSSS